MEPIIIFFACISAAAIGLWYGLTFLDNDVYNTHPEDKKLAHFLKRVKSNSARMKYHH